MRTPRRLSRLPVLVLLACSAFAAACTPATPSTSASTPFGGTIPPSIAAGPLVTIEVRGGECPRGACGQTTVIERDGRVHVTEPEPADVAMLPQPVLEALVTEVDAADFDALATKPFTGECPTAFDGQEVVFTFAAQNGARRFASCEVEINFDQPLFAAAMDAAGLGAPAP